MLLESIWRDMRHAARLLRRSLGFTATAVAVLALGIGANTAIFSVVNTVLLRPLPYPEADRIVQLMINTAVGSFNVTSLSRYAYWREQTQAFDHIAAYDLGWAEAKPRDSAQKPLRMLHCSADYFSLFGASTAIGRVFTAEEDRAGGPPVVVVSEAVWRSRLKGDGNLARASIVIEDASYEVIGVMRAEFAADPSVDVWLPLRANPYSADHSSQIRVAARLRRGVSIEMADRQIGYLTWPFERLHPGVLGPRERFTARPLRDVMIGDVAPLLFLLSGAVLFVLLIACANVANLLMARSAQRAPEIATRAALGAGRSRILLQLLAESSLLAVGGGAVGLWLGHAGVRVLVALSPGSLPRMNDPGGISLDPQVVLFTLVLTAFTGALFGLLPAIAASRVNLSAVLNRSAAGAASQSHARRILVAAETALALVLLIGSGLLIRTFVAMHNTDRGFDASNILTLEMSIGTPRFERSAAVAQLIRNAEQRFDSFPGVVSMAAANSVPLEPGAAFTFQIERRPLLRSPFHGIANWRSVSWRYFDVFHIPLMRGRLFTREEERSGARVFVINAAMAAKYWPGGEPLGERLSIADTSGQIIGIVANARDTGLDRDAEPAVYVPAAQVTDAMNVQNHRARPLTWTIRTIGDPWRLSLVIQRELREASGGLPIGRVRSMEEIVADSTARARFTLTLLTAFAAIALVLAAVGIYGLVSYSVEQRTREIGIRVAIGATPGNVRNLVLGEGLRLALLGIAAGAIAAAWLTKFLEGMIYGVQSWDPATFALAAAVLALIAVSAAYLPAKRATRVDPLVALRND